MDQVSEVDGRSYSGDESSCGGNGPGKQLRHVFTLIGQFANKPDCGQSSRRLVNWQTAIFLITERLCCIFTQNLNLTITLTLSAI